MSIEKLTSQNSAIVLVDYAVGFANLFRSHGIEENVNAATALVKTAQAFDVPLVVTAGQDSDAPGPIYPRVLAALGDHPVVRRGGEFDAFDSPAFEAAVRATGRTKLVIAGLMTEGCVLQTALGGLRRGYDVHVVVDASAGETTEAHQVALQRMVQAGVVPVTWMSVATEYQVSWGNFGTVRQYAGLIADHSPQLGMNLLTHAATTAAATDAAQQDAAPASIEDRPLASV